MGGEVFWRWRGGAFFWRCLFFNHRQYLLIKAPRRKGTVFFPFLTNDSCDLVVVGKIYDSEFNQEIFTQEKLGRGCWRCSEYMERIKWLGSKWEF